MRKTFADEPLGTSYELKIPKIGWDQTEDPFQELVHANPAFTPANVAKSKLDFALSFSGGTGRGFHLVLRVRENEKALGGWCRLLWQFVFPLHVVRR